PLLILDRHAGQDAAQSIVGRDVDHACLRAEGNRRPVLAPVRTRAEVSLLPRTWFASGVDVRPSSLRIETWKYRLRDERFPFHEADWPGAAFEEPQVPVARHVDQSSDRAVVALVVDENRRRNFIPVPRFVRVVLEVPLDLSRRAMCRNG